MKRTLTVVLASGALIAGAVAPASANHHRVTQVVGDGLVNVQIGNVTILRNVDVDLAAQVVANVCGVDVGPVAVLGTAVDASGDSEVVCTARPGDVTISG